MDKRHVTALWRGILLTCRRVVLAIATRQNPDVTGSERKAPYSAKIVLTSVAASRLKSIGCGK